MLTNNSRETKFAILGRNCLKSPKLKFVGDYVFVQGRVGEFWDRRQLTINGLGCKIGVVPLT